MSVYVARELSTFSTTRPPTVSLPPGLHVHLTGRHLLTRDVCQYSAGCWCFQDKPALFASVSSCLVHCEMATMGVSQPLMTQDTPPYPNTPPYPHTPQYPPMPPPQYQPMVAMTPVVAAPAAPTQNNVTQQTVVVNQPGDGEMGGRKERLFVDPEGVRGWSTGLCACLNDLGSCE
ncbi:hypothetical protein BaRGS_00029894 [Batillaria attramentaria]|uniref:Uncharacterized protein n=1 Tax=Batillaria attramentaria TaxID=370345 RepID=A0ABD0JVL6_9CAEN